MPRPLYAVLWTAFIVLLLSILYWGLKASLTVRDAGAVRSHVYRLSVPMGDNPSAMPPVLTARQGDTITLIVRSDRTAEVHVHGTEERTVALSRGHEATLTLTVKDAGRFPVHVHNPDGSMYPLGMLEVQPR